MRGKASSFENWNEFYQRYVLIFNLIVVVSLVPFGWMYLQLEHGLFEPYFSDATTQWLGAGVLMPLVGFGLFKSYRDTRKRIIGIPKDYSVRSKLSVYYSLQIKKFVKYELIAIASLLCMLVFQPVVFAVFYIFILFVFSLDWPKYTKVVEHLRLSKEEQDLLATAESLPD